MTKPSTEVGYGDQVGTEYPLTPDPVPSGSAAESGGRTTDGPNSVGQVDGQRVMTGHTGRVRTKSAAGLSLASRRAPGPHGGGDPVVWPVRLKMIGGLGNTRRCTPTVEIVVISDVIASALAQLVRDRWAVEQRELEESGARLRDMVTRR